MRALPADIAALIDAAAARHGVDRFLARAVAWVESRGRTDAVSDKGAQGVFQLMPATAESLGVSDPFDPAENIDAGVRFLAKLLQRWPWPQGDHALAGYCWGPGHVSRNDTWPDSVRTYVQRVRTRAELERAADAGLEPVSSSSSDGRSARSAGAGVGLLLAFGVVYLFLHQRRRGG